MAKQNREMTPGFKVRIAGGLWLIVIAAGSLAVGTAATLVVGDDVVGTANNILVKETMIRFSVVADLVTPH